jgi:uncharacterized DUF497 family protein
VIAIKCLKKIFTHVIAKPILKKLRELRLSSPQKVVFERLRRKVIRNLHRVPDGEVICVISAKKANDNERRPYYKVRVRA